VTPDAVVGTNKFLRSAPNSKNFALVNSTTGKVTQFINHPQNKGTFFGVPVTRVEAIHYDLKGGGTTREDGVGTTGKAPGNSTWFLNSRGGDTNLALGKKNGISVNVGFFTPIANAQGLVDKLPNTGKTKLLRGATEGVMSASKATDSQIGFAWRATAYYDSKTNKAMLNVSGTEWELKDFTQGAAKQTNVAALNYEKKTVARANNEEAYLKGANPFQLADDTRTPGGQYKNHTDAISNIAGGVRNLQQQIDGKTAKPVRTNDEAAKVLESAIGLSQPITPQEAKKYRQIDGIKDVTVSSNALSPSVRSNLNTTLINLDKAGVYFSSETVKAAAAQASQNSGNKSTLKPAERSFTREVFEGKYRSQAVHQYNGGDLARDVLLGINRFTAIATAVFDAQGLSDGTMKLPNAKAAADKKGFSSRMNLVGGTSKALGLKTPTAQTKQTSDERATTALSNILSQRVSAKKQEPSAEARYQEFNRLTASEKRAVAAQVQADLNRP
jgi:hypothetical protein